MSSVGWQPVEPGSGVHWRESGVAATPTMVAEVLENTFSC